MAKTLREISPMKPTSSEKAQTVSSVLDTVESLVQELASQSERILTFVNGADPCCDEKGCALPSDLLSRLQILRENLRSVSSYQSQIMDKLGM